MNEQIVRAFAPATVANLATGLDVLGLAIDGPGDVVTARRVPGTGVRITAVTGDGGHLPTDVDRNTAGIAATATLCRAGVEAGVALTLEKGLPLGSGLGGSAASAAAAAFAVNRLVGSPLRKGQLVEPCLEAEAVVSGCHADNVAPSLLGGLILVRSLNPLDLIRLPIPEGLAMAVVSPEFESETRAAREVLPDQVPLSAMIQNTANIAGLVAACFSGDVSLLGRCIADDVVTPARTALIPGCDEVIRAALDHGALGSSISGSGPAVFALCRSRRSAREVAEAMKRAFEEAGLQSKAIVSPADCPGVRER
ncbi:MAG: homoserine kinase [Deltaproteobacteria bacterium]|nr:homoserine kinase [Deltaproteobacteria bacterium]